MLIGGDRSARPRPIRTTATSIRWISSSLIPQVDHRCATRWSSRRSWKAWSPVASTDGQLRMKLAAPEQGLRGFHYGSHIRARLVWFNPDAIAHDEA
jgi:hypothetical protein